MKEPPKLSLRSRVILTIIFLQIAGIAVFAAFQVTSEYFTLRRRLQDTAMISARCIGHACMEPLMARDNLLLEEHLAMSKYQHGREIQYILVQNVDGSILRSVPPGFEGRRLSDPLSAAALTVSTSRVQEIHLERNTNSIYAGVMFDVAVPLYAKQQKLGILRLGVSGNEIGDHIKEVIWRSLLMFAAAVSLGLLLAYIVDRKITQSLRELIRVSQKMARGDLSERVQIHTGDDLEALGNAFNRMAQDLGSAQEELQRWASELESKVRERTLDLEREKQKLVGIVSSIGGGLVLLDREMRVRWTNPTTDRWFGPQRQRLGRECNLCNGAYWKADRFCPRCPSREALESGSPVQQEKRFTDPTDRTVFFRITASPVKDPSGRVVQVVELIQDITKEKETQAKLLNVSKMAAIGEAASGIAHQLNNPLAIVGAHAERLQEILISRDRPSSADQAKIPAYLDTIQRHVYRCSNVIEKLLNFARVREIEPRWTELKGLAEESLSMARPFAKEKGVRLQPRLASDLPRFRSDPESLVQVLFNLLSNAVDATGPGGEVCLTSAYAQGQIALSVTDNGTGIPEKEIPKIMEPFYTTKPAGKGTGLGLSFCVKILERLRGTLRVKSKLNRGTTFTIMLPLDMEIG